MRPGTLNVLLINREQTENEVYEHFLHQSFAGDLMITVVENVEHAQAYMQDKTPDCILLDYDSDIVSTMKFIQEISKESHMSTPTIAFIEKNYHEVAKRLIELGAYDCLEKSRVSRESLHHTVSTAMQRKVLLSKLNSHAEKIKYLEHFDIQTDLPNRLQFNDILERTVTRNTRYDRPMALLFLSIDTTNILNHSDNFYAHFLSEFVSRIKKCVRKNDTIARLGSSDFAIVLDEIYQFQDAGVVAQKIINEITMPYEIEQIHATIFSYIGISCFPIGGRTADDLIKHADIALLNAKNDSYNSYQFFTEELQTQYSHRVLVESALQGAVSNNEFSVVYQPIVDVNTSQVMSLEALIRWRNKKLGDVSPSDFIPIAENSGQIISIGEWAIQEVCKHYQELVAQSLDRVKIATNLSARQLQDESLFQMYDDVIRSSNLDHRHFIFELTETATMLNLEIAKHTLRAMESQRRWRVVCGSRRFFVERKRIQKIFRRRPAI